MKNLLKDGLESIVALVLVFGGTYFAIAYQNQIISIVSVAGVILAIVGALLLVAFLIISIFVIIAGN